MASPPEGYAPTVGIIGAVLGLIQVMQHLDDITEVGRGIAVAFVATIYGVGAANLFFLPVAGKIKMRIREEQIVREMQLEGVISILEGMNPRMIETKLLAFFSEASHKADAKKAKAQRAPSQPRSAGDGMSRKKRHEEHVNHERWLVSYADFITLLFAFFVVLYSSSQVDKRKVGQLSLAIQVAFQQMGVFETSNTKLPLSTSGPMPFQDVQAVENTVREPGSISALYSPRRELPAMSPPLPPTSPTSRVKSSAPWPLKFGVTSFSSA